MASPSVPEPVSAADIAAQEARNAAEGAAGGDQGGQKEEDTTPDAATPEEETASSELLRPRKNGLHLFFLNIGKVFKQDEIGSEITRIAVPASLALAADPLASLVDTAFIGRLGSVEVGAVGVAIAIFNQVSKVCIYPLVSVTTSFVAEEDTIISKGIEEDRMEDVEKPSETRQPPSSDENDSSSVANEGEDAAAQSATHVRRKRHIPSVTSALIVGGFLGLLQAIFLILAAKFLLNVMGVRAHSPMLTPALEYLKLRSLGAPAVLLSLAMQGVFRGFKDTRTPLYATVAGDASNIILDPIFMFVFHLGVRGAAIAHVISQYLITAILLFRLMQRVHVIPSSIKSLKLGRFLRCGFLLLARVIAVTFCVTISASLAANHGPVIMAAFQICCQIWMASSLLADGLAVSVQAIIATAFANNDHRKVVLATARVLQLCIMLGSGLTVFLGVAMRFGSGVFTKDANVIKVIISGIPFVSGTQIINSLAFLLDGVNFGASDFAYAAYSMVTVAAVCIPCMLMLSKYYGFIGIWIGLTLYMSLRTLASTWRLASATGPWKFIRK